MFLSYPSPFGLFSIPTLIFISVTIHNLFSPHWTEYYYCVSKYKNGNSLNCHWLLGRPYKRQSACILLLYTELCLSPLHPNSKRYIAVLTLVPQNVTLFGYRVILTDIISLDEVILMMSATWPVLWEKTWRNRDTDRRWRPILEWCIYKPWNAKGDRPSPEARREAWRGFFLNALRKNQACWYLDFRLLTSRTVRKQISAVLSYLISGISSQKP